MRIGLAFRVFFAALFDAAAGPRLQQALLAAPAPAQAPVPGAERQIGPVPQSATLKSAAPQPVARNGALALLSALQREARFLDIVQEPLGEYSDAQIGAAARDVLRNCAGVMDRWFSLQPVLVQEEGTSVEVPRGYDPQRFRVVGNVAGDPPFRGQLVHRGWVATKCDLPAWSGDSSSAMVVAPVEVEVGAS